MYRQAWQGGRTFDAFFGSIDEDRDLWETMAERARIDGATLQRPLREAGPGASSSSPAPGPHEAVDRA